MPQFGEVRVDFVTFTTGVSPSEANVTASVSGLIKNPTFSGDVVVKNNLDVEGNITISGTVTGNAAGFTSVTGTTVTGTTANFTSGVFTTQISGATITGDAGQFNTLTGNTAGFTSITGTTVTGTTANFVTVSGTTVTGNTGNFTTATTTTANVTSGIFASGTAAAPSVSVGTTDNGIYSPGTDQLAISTNGTGRLFVDASGNAGVGTSSPSTAVTQFGGSARGLAVSQSQPVVALEDTSASTYAYFGLSNNDLYIDNLGTGFTRFYTNGDERMRIDSSGNVGIGNISPANSAGYNTLTIGNGTSTGGQLLLENAAGNNFFIWHDSNGANIYNQSATSQIFYTNAQERMRIDSSGNVGIGTSSPGQLLHIYQVATNSQAYQVIENNRSRNAATEYKTTLGSWYVGNGIGADVNRFTIYQGTDRLVIDSSGRVGIGTTSPGQLLQVGSSDGEIRIGGGAGLDITHDNSGSTVAEIKQLYSTTSAGAQLKITSGFTSFHTGTSNTERARIDSSGRLLVGTSSARAIGTGNFQLQAEGSGTLAGISTTRNDNNTAGSNIRFVKTRGTSDGSTNLVINGDQLGTLGYWGTDGTNAIEAASIIAFVDGTPGTNDMPGRLEFSTTADGASSPTKRMRIDSAGKLNNFTDTTVQFRSARTTSNQGILSVATGVTDIDSGGSTVFIVRQDGDVENSNGTYTTISDVSFKENIVDAQSQWEDLKAVQIRNFNFTAETGWSNHKQIGVVAQELEQVCPNLVKDVNAIDSDETYKTVKTSILYMKAVKALQEAMERIETLEAKVAALEAS